MSNNIFYDFEFAEDGRTITPISLGMVKESGEALYKQFLNFNPSICNEWVQNNVLPYLYRCTEYAEQNLSLAVEIHIHRMEGCSNIDCPWSFKTDAAMEVQQFVDGVEPPTFYGWYSAYDHVALAQLYGAMVDLPHGWPMWTFDLKQWHKMIGEPVLPLQESVKHNALEDARENLKRYQFLKDYTINEMKRIDSLYRKGHMDF